MRPERALYNDDTTYYPPEPSPAGKGQVLFGRFLILDENCVENGSGISDRVVMDLEHLCKKAVLRLFPDIRAGSSPHLFFQTLKSIGHPNIEKYLEIGTFPDGSAFVVREFGSGKELEKLIGDGRRFDLRRT